MERNTPPGKVSYYYVPSSRTVCNRTPLEEPGTNPSRGVLLQEETPPGGGVSFDQIVLAQVQEGHLKETMYMHNKLYIGIQITKEEIDENMSYIYVSARANLSIHLWIYI